MPPGRGHEEPTGRPRRLIGSRRGGAWSRPGELPRRPAPRRRAGSPARAASRVPAARRGVRSPSSLIHSPTAPPAGVSAKAPTTAAAAMSACRQNRPTPPLRRQGLARLPGRSDDAPASPLRLELVGRLHGEELLTKVELRSLRAPRRSIPGVRRAPGARRELTVPRGSSSTPAISPGVYSSRKRRTTTARCSGDSVASARTTSSDTGAVRSAVGAGRSPTCSSPSSRRSDRARVQSIALLTTIRWSQGPNGRRASKRSSDLTAARKASCAMSSAAAAS